MSRFFVEYYCSVLFGFRGSWSWCELRIFSRANIQVVLRASWSYLIWKFSRWPRSKSLIRRAILFQQNIYSLAPKIEQKSGDVRLFRCTGAQVLKLSACYLAGLPAQAFPPTTYTTDCFKYYAEGLTITVSHIQEHREHWSSLN